MKSKSLLIMEDQTGKVSGACFPDLPGTFAAGHSQRQVEVVAREAADQELGELSTLSAAKIGPSL